MSVFTSVCVCVCVFGPAGREGHSCLIHSKHLQFLFFYILIRKSEFRLQRKWVMRSVSNMGGVVSRKWAGRVGGVVTANSTAQRMLMPEKIYRVEAQNRCSVTKISPNSKNILLFSVVLPLLMHRCCSSARLKLNFQLWETRPACFTRRSVHSVHK